MTPAVFVGHVGCRLFYLSTFLSSRLIIDVFFPVIVPPQDSMVSSQRLTVSLAAASQQPSTLSRIASFSGESGKLPIM